MKKILTYGIFIVAASLISACSQEDNLTVQKPTKGMTLSATVPQEDTKAEFDMSNSTWKFSFTTNDNVSVTNNKVSEGTFYTFTKPASGKFSSADATTTLETATWYAYFPQVNASGIIDLTNQDGTQAGIANLYAMAAKQENVAAGTVSLSFTMNPKVAILKITNPLSTAVNVYIKNSEGKYITGLTPSEDGFTVNTQDDAAVACGNIAASGTAYVVVPSNIEISVSFSSGYSKSTKSTGLAAAKYYPITINNIAVLPGKFTVGSDGHKVQFAAGNLYWNGSTYGFEDNQYDTRTSWDPNHVTHFYKYYHGADGKPYDQNYNNSYVFDKSTASKNSIEMDYLFDGFRLLTKEEMTYLHDTRKVTENHSNSKKTIDGVDYYYFMLIYPDDYSGSKGENTWESINNAGIVFMPVSGRRNGTIFTATTNYGYMMVGSSTGYTSTSFNYGLGAALNSFTEGFIVRLVKDAE